MNIEHSSIEVSPERQDYDTPRKKILETYFPQFMQFFFPDIAKDVDWLRGYEFLDKELHQVAREAVVGRRAVDR